MSSLQSRILVAVLGIPLIIWIVLWAPTLVLEIALMILAAVAAYELMNCVGADKMLWAICGVWAAAAVCWCYGKPESINVLWALFVFLLFTYAVIGAGAIKTVQVMAGIFAVICIPYSFSAFIRMEAMDIHRGVLFLPFILSFACDTFAYIAGLTMGKHKLAPKVSPQKTIEGSIGGLLGNIACGELFVFMMERYFGGSPINYGAMAVLALVCGIVSQVGDLSFSLIKREFGIKDYGHLFLAHGGVLDRFDSVLFVTPVIEMVLKLVMQ